MNAYNTIAVDTSALMLEHTSRDNHALLFAW